MDLDSLLAGFDRVATRPELVAALGRHRFDNLVKSGALVSVFPRAYALPWDADLPAVRRRAALRSVGGEAALSHLTSLLLRALPVDEHAPIHVTAYQPRHPRGVADQLVVHRTLRPLDAQFVDELPVVRLEEALTSSWPLLGSGAEQRAPAIEAARRRLISVPRFAQLAHDAWWLPGGRDLRALTAQLAAGCESELELYGYLDVFDVPGLRDFARQRVVHVNGKAYRLDIAYDAEMLNVELDGRAFHDSPEQWERNIARDLQLATVGWQTIRLSHRRLHADVDGCRVDVHAVRDIRRHDRRSA